MDALKTFISQKFRPEVLGGNLDKEHTTIFHISNEEDSQKEYLFLNAICFGPRKDNVLINLEHALTSDDNI